MKSLYQKLILKMTTSKRNQKGFSLIEVMVVVGILSILVMALPSMLQVLFVAQKETTAMTNIRDVRQRFRTLLLDSGSWGLTVENEAGLACLLPTSVTPCLQSATPMPVPGIGTDFTAAPYSILRDVYDSDLVTPVVFYSSNTAVTATTPQGFTLDGVPCTKASVAGDVKCPVTFMVSYYLACPGGPGSSCVNPLIYLNIIPKYDPGTAAVKLNFFDITRPLSFVRGTGENLKNQAFSISHHTTGATAGGVCTLGVDNLRIFDNNPLPGGSKFDPYGIVTVDATGFTLGPGTYECEASAVCFSCGGFRVRIVDASSVEYARSNDGFAGLWNQVEVSMPTFTIKILAATHFDMVQTCSSLPGGTPNADIYGLGLPIPSLGGGYGSSKNDYAQVACTLIH